MAFLRYFLNLAFLSSVGSAAALAADFSKGGVAVSAASSSENTTDLAVAAPAAVAASSSWKLLGCYTDSVSARSLPYGAGVAGGPTAMTNELCQSTCLAAGYSLAGTEYSDECCKHLCHVCYGITLTIL
jgi:WSC domain